MSFVIFKNYLVSTSLKKKKFSNGNDWNTYCNPVSITVSAQMPLFAQKKLHRNRLSIHEMQFIMQLNVRSRRYKSGWGLRKHNMLNNT